MLIYISGQIFPSHHTSEPRGNGEKDEGSLFGHPGHHGFDLASDGDNGDVRFRRRKRDV